MSISTQLATLQDRSANEGLYRKDKAMKNLISTLFLLVALAPLNIYAHGGKDHNKHNEAKVDTLTIVNGDTIAVNGHPKNSKIQTMTKEEIKEEKFELNFGERMFEHPHNKIVHFPIAFGYLLLIFMIIGYKVEVCHRASKIIVVLGMLSSIITAILGLLQTGPFIGTKMYSYVELHRNLAFISVFIYALLTWAIFRRSPRKIQFVLVLTLTVLITLIGFLGGVISHS